jgi:hypothetical protein
VARDAYHVLGDARLRDLKPELEQFAVDAWRAPKRIFDAHLPDQHAQLRLDLRASSQWARLPTPVTAKARPVPTHQRLGPDDRQNLQDRREPSVNLDKEPAIIVREPDATMQPTLQDNQLMSKHRVLSFKPQLRLEWRGQDGQNETEQPDHSASLGDSITSSTQIRFSVHTPMLSTYRTNDSMIEATRPMLFFPTWALTTPASVFLPASPPSEPAFRARFVATVTRWGRVGRSAGTGILPAFGAWPRTLLQGLRREAA